MNRFSQVKHYIETHFGAVLLGGCLLGLVVPQIAELPASTAVLVLALLMFFSCYRLGEGGFAAMRWKHVCVFWFCRYGILPLVLWGIAKLVVPGYALGVFLLTVVPAGVSSPAIAHIYGGLVAPGFAIVILSQLATPFLIPAQFALLAKLDAASGGAAVAPSPLDLFVTMVWCIFVPIIVFYCVRGHQGLKEYALRQNKFFSMLLIAFVIALAIAKQRDILLSHVPDMAMSLVVAVLCFVTYMVAAWVFAAKLEKAERVTFAACSAFNNAALGVSLALLHFSGPVILFVAVSEIAWACLPMLFSIFLRKVSASKRVIVTDELL